MKRVLNRIFGKLVMGIIAILLQIGWLIAVLYMASEYYKFMSVMIHGVSVILALYLVYKDMRPYNTLSWVFIILLLPVIGLSSYFMFGRSGLTRKNRRRMEDVNRLINPWLSGKEEIQNEIREISTGAYHQSTYMTNFVPCALCREEETDYFSSGEETFSHLLEDLESAKHFIFIEFFIIGLGEMYYAVEKILERKVREGVLVRIIYDDLGCIGTLPPKYYKTLQQKGIQCAAFNPFRPFLSVIMNNRDHRKTIVIDGLTAYTGGVNLADEYTNKVTKYGYWKDAGIRITGEGVWNFTAMFMQMWNYITRGEEDPLKYRIDQTTPKRPGQGFVQPYFDSPLDNEDVGETVYLNLINQAKDYVYIFTPYLIIDSEMSTSLINAAKSGVDVRIVTPGIPDKKVVYLLTKSYYGHLIRGGVKIFQYTPGFIHSKCFVADDEYAIVGTVNLDYRSLYLHFECGVWMYRCSAVRQVKEDALRTFAESELVELAACENKNFFFTMFMSVLRLCAPLL